jgi:cobalt-precorrin-7 (C5)-methyltransferase
MTNKITIIGCGPGAADLITIRGLEAIKTADLIAGSARLIETFAKDTSAQTTIIETDYSERLEELANAPTKIKIVLLVSGDPLFSSLGSLAIKKLNKENCEVIAGVSSFQQAFASLKEGWTEYNIISLHGKEDSDIKKIFNDNQSFALLLDPTRNLKYIKETIGELVGKKYSYHVATNLSLPGEELHKINYNELATHPEESLSILIVRRTIDE